MDNKTNTCSMCRTAFNAQDEMLKHSQSAHASTSTASAQEAIICSMCGANFSTSAELENHAKEHQAV